MFENFSRENKGYAAFRPLAETTPVDRAAVARLRRALATGAYRIDADAIAQAMIADLPSPKRRRVTE